MRIPRWSRYWSGAFPLLGGVTWPGPIPYLALSSGTTSGTTKYIPVSPEMLRAARFRFRWTCIGQKLRDAEIEKLGCAIGTDQNVAGLQIAVHNQPGVGVLYGFGNLLKEP